MTSSGEDTGRQRTEHAGSLRVRLCPHRPRSPDHEMLRATFDGERNQCGRDVAGHALYDDADLLDLVLLTAEE